MGGHAVSVLDDGCKQWRAREIHNVLMEADVALATEQELIASRGIDWLGEISHFLV